MSDRLTLTALPSSEWYSEPFADGTLYFNGGQDSKTKQAVELLRSLALGESVESFPVVNASGLTSTIYDGGNGLIIKAFNKVPQMNHQQRPERPRNSGLPYLQASVALNEGLGHMDEITSYEEGGVRFRFESPIMYGLYRPKWPRDTKPPISVMARAAGNGREQLGQTPIPSLRLRRRAYDDALRAASLPRHRVYLEDIGDNTLVKAEGPGEVRISRLDILGVGRWLWPIHPRSTRELVARNIDRIGSLVFSN